MMHTLIKRRGSHILFWVVLILFAASFFITSLLGILKCQVFNADFYCRALADRRMDDGLYDLICKDITSECDFNAFPSEVILNSVSKDSVVSSKNLYVKAFFEKFLSGEKIDSVKADYPAEDILAAIGQYAESSSDKADFYDREENRKLLAVSLQEIIEGEIGSFSSSTAIKLIGKVRPKWNALSARADYFPYFLFAVIILFLILCWTVIRDVKRYLYSASLFCFIVSDFYFVLFFMLMIYNLPQKMALENTSLIIYFRSVWDRLIGIDTVAFGILTVAFLAAFIYSVFLVKNRREATADNNWEEEI